MAEQSRSFRKFMSDPKSSVMTYIADNIPQAHQQGNPSLGNSQNSSISGHQVNDQYPNRIQQNLGENQANLSQGPLGHPQDPYSAASQPTPPLPAYVQQAQTSQGPFSQAYAASSLNQLVPHPATDSMLQSIPRPDPPQWQIPDQVSQTQHRRDQNNVQSVSSLGQGPPAVGTRSKTSPQSAPRQYHRMVLDFESAKHAFNVARSQHDFQSVASAAYELEAKSGRIWSLRVEHAWEFEGFSESGHQSVISGWQAQFELWADTVLDIEEGHYSANDANTIAHGSVSVNAASQGLDLEKRQDEMGSFEASSNTQASMPIRTPQTAQMQDHSLSHNALPQQNLADTQGTQSPPSGTIFQSSTRPSSNTTMNSGNPMGQEHRNPQHAQQMLPGQSTAFDLGSTVPGQGMPPGQGPYQQGQNALQLGARYPQQGLNQPQGASFNQQQSMPLVISGKPQQGQVIPPGAGSSTQQPPNMSQGPPLTIQQRPNMAQGPSGPARNQTPPRQNMQAYPSPRPQMPGILQAGGPVQGNVRN